MGGGIEKPLLKISGKSMLQREIEVLRRASSVERIVVASTSNTPGTTMETKMLGVESIITPGEGFENDMRFAIRQLTLGDVLVVSADLPFLTVEIIERAAKEYHGSGRPALAVMARPELYDEMGSKPQHVFNINGQSLVPVGINIIDGTRINEGALDQTELVVDSSDIVLNVNTKNELESARKMVAMSEKQAHGSKKVQRTLQVARISAFAALSVIGSFIHLPSPIPSVAFDSAPGFFVALYFGSLDGFCVLGLGHLATAVVSGFPLGYLHFPIALGLACGGAATGFVNRKWSYIPAIATGIAINTALVILAIPVLGLAATLAFTPFLLLAAIANGALATVVYVALRRRLRNG